MTYDYARLFEQNDTVYRVILTAIVRRVNEINAESAEKAERG